LLLIYTISFIYEIMIKVILIIATTILSFAISFAIFNYALLFAQVPSGQQSPPSQAAQPGQTAQSNQTAQTNQTGHPGQTGQPSLPGPSVSSDHTGNNKSEQISQTIQTGHSGQNQSGQSVSAKGPLDQLGASLGKIFGPK
jgi:hypothetical protein